LQTSAAIAENKDSATTEQPVRSILLVDDLPANVIVVCEFLKQFGYSFAVASNGYEAIDKFKDGPFSAVLMDLQMPGMSGLEATSVIRAYEQQKALPKVPIIGMTAYASLGNREDCIASGMDDCIAKPLKPDELRKIIEKALDSKSGQRIK
jgi:CheY-like chemotaxis protein